MAAKPSQFLGRDLIVSRISSLNVGRAEELEAVFFKLGAGWPDHGEARIKRFYEVPQAHQVMRFWRIKRQDQ